MVQRALLCRCGSRTPLAASRPLSGEEPAAGSSGRLEALSDAQVAALYDAGAFSANRAQAHIRGHSDRCCVALVRQIALRAAAADHESARDWSGTGAA